MLTRRSVVSGMSLLAAVPMIRPNSLFSQSGTEFPHLSPSVLLFAETRIVALCKSIHGQNATRSEGIEVVSALGLLFSHLQETGFNDKLTQDIKGRADAIRNLPVPSGRIQALTADLKKSGIALTASDAEGLFDLDSGRRSAALSQIQSEGIAGAEKAILSQFNQSVQTLPMREDTVFASPLAYHGGARLERVNCAANAALCSLLAVFSPPPLDAVMAAAAAVYAGLAAFNLC